MRREYRTIMLRAGGAFFGGAVDGQELTDRLDELGAEGWEPASAFDTNMGRGRTRDVLAVPEREARERARGRS